MKMEKQKIKQLTSKTSGNAIKCIREGIDFNLRVNDKECIMFVGGILSKLVNDQQFVFIKERGWVGI